MYFITLNPIIGSYNLSIIRINLRFLIKSRNKSKAISLIYILNLVLKLDSLILKFKKLLKFIFKKFNIILINFKVENKPEKARFFPIFFLIITINKKFKLKFLFLFLIILFA